jgi:hypothetical protein
LTDHTRTNFQGRTIFLEAQTLEMGVRGNTLGFGGRFDFFDLLGMRREEKGVTFILGIFN